MSDDIQKLIEIGIDVPKMLSFSRSRLPVEKILDGFKQACEVAIKTKKPVIFHVSKLVGRRVPKTTLQSNKVLNEEIVKIANSYGLKVYISERRVNNERHGVYVIFH